VDIPNACKGSARRNAASNGKRNFHRKKNRWIGFKKWIGVGIASLEGASTSRTALRARRVVSDWDTGLELMQEWKMLERVRLVFAKRFGVGGVASVLH
jgi:hypothetical protein